MKALLSKLSTPLLILSLLLSGAVLSGCGDDQAGTGDESYNPEETPASPRGDPQESAADDE